MVKEKHYKLSKKDFDELMKGKEIFFYNGGEIQIYLRFDETILK